MLVFFNVMSDNPHDFTIASIGLDLLFTVPCLLLAVAFYFLFERHTDGVRIWIKHMWTKHIAMQRSPELLPDNLKLSASASSRKNAQS
jgi:hypothetical protein